MSGLSLYDVENDLLALADTDAMVSDEQRAEFEAALGRALASAVAKRDAFAQFIRTCHSQADFCQLEIERLTDRKRRFLAAAERAEAFAVAVIRGLGVDEKGRYRKLEGQVATLAVRAKPGRVVVDDEGLIPADFWRFPAPPAPVVDKVAVREALRLGRDVPGARLVTDEYRLEVK